MIICICNNINQSILEQYDSFDELSLNENIGTSCGKCLEFIKEYYKKRLILKKE